MSESREITIADNGTMLRLRYSALLEYHGRGAVFGATVGFRALQAAGQVLSSSETWDRKNIKVHTEHPGPGVRDAIEFVTRCVTRGEFQAPSETRCNSGMKFIWTVTDGDRSVNVRLRNNFLPQRFFDLLDTISKDQENPKYRQEFDRMKIRLSRDLWDQPLDRLYETNFIENLDYA